MHVTTHVLLDGDFRRMALILTTLDSPVPCAVAGEYAWNIATAIMLLS